MTQAKQTDAIIREANCAYIGDMWIGPDVLRDHARALAAKIDRIEERIRRDYSRGIDMDVRDDLVAILREEP